MDGFVLGAAGAVGREVAAGLVAARTFDRVVLGDLDRARLRATAERLDGSATVRRVDASDGSALRRAIRGARVLINCTTYRLGIPVLRAAIAEGVDYVDLGGLYNTPKQLEMDGRARRAGVRAVIGCGATPGLSNVLVRRAADRLDAVRAVHISFASHRDLAPSPGLLDTLLDEFRPGVPRFIWRRGGFQRVEAFDGARKVRFPAPIGTQEVYFVPHSETYTLPRSLGPELEEVAVRGTWRPEDMRALAALARLGLTADREVQVDGVRVKPLEVVRAAILAQPPRKPDAPCAFFLNVEVRGVREGAETVIRQRASHPMRWGAAATGRMTAIPAVVGAGLLAAGQAHGAGVLPPERAFDPVPFLEAVGQRGVRVTSSTRKVAAETEG
jgi:lysine 6-dehydrogenase